MATRRSARPSKPPGRRRRRTPEEIIADLERKIEKVRRRKAVLELKRSAAARSALAAVKALDKGLLEAEREGDVGLRHALADAREPLEHLLGERGIALARTPRPKGPRPK